MLLRHGSSAGQGIVEIRRDGSLPVDELLDYDFLRVFEATVADLEQVLADGREIKHDGTVKERFKGHYDGNNQLIALASTQGHSDVVQARLDERLYMEPAYWGDGRMTKIMLHGTFRKHWASVSRGGLKAGGGWKDRAFIFLVSLEDGVMQHPGLRANTDVIVRVDMERFMAAGGVGWWTDNNCFQTRGLFDDKEIGIPTRFLVNITLRSSGEELWALPTPTK